MAETETRQIRMYTPLVNGDGSQKLHFWRMRGDEHLGRLFEYELDLLSDDDDIPFADVIRQNATITVELSNGDAQPIPGSPYNPGDPRFFNGYFSAFGLVGRVGRRMHYRATLVPWLWFLTRTSDCRIFQNQTVPQIIRQVLKDNGFDAYIEDRLHPEDYRQWEYCVQYRETDFDFISRLMEEEGIYYFLRHENGRHTLILLDSIPRHNAWPGYESMLFCPPTRSITGTEYIRSWKARQQVQPGRYAHTDFDFKRPAVELLTASSPGGPTAAPECEVFDYPGGYHVRSDGEAYARRRIEAIYAEQEVAEAEGEVRGIGVGCLFELTGHDRVDQCKRYLVTGTHIEVESDIPESRAPGAAGDGENFSVRFSAVDAAVTFRTQRTTPKPMIRGPQTAMVVGPAGEEIHTDEHGRVKVQFHWDRYSEANENSSCWIRVSQGWAGKRWGSMFLPRIGHEVIVEFLEGDPDRPIVTGRVYNGDTVPPYDLPTNMTMSTMKSLSSKGGGGFNEIRFEDKKGEEQIFVHAEKNQDVRVKNDCFEWIGNDRHLLVKKDQFEHVENNRHEVVDADHMEEIGKDRHLKVKGKQAVEVTGSNSLTVTGDVIEAFKANHSEEVSQNYYVKGLSLVIEGTTDITLKVGGNSVVIDSLGVSISGPTVTIDGQTVTKIACGPGSPAGVGTAGLAVTPAGPTAAEEADTADPGEMTEVKARQREQKAGKYGKVKSKPFKPPQLPSAGAAATAAGRVDKKLSWIEVKLIDNIGNPVPGERYKVTLPDGTTVAEGTLDEKGLVRIEGIDPGTCHITFPDFDGRSWDRA